jgi:hypothetical protein
MSPVAYLGNAFAFIQQENPRSASVTLMKCKKKVFYCEIRVADLYGLTIKLA